MILIEHGCIEDFPHRGKVGEGWGKTLVMVLRVPPCFPHFSPQGEGTKDQICATLLIKMKVLNAYEASPTQDMVLRVSPCFPHLPPQGEGFKDQICATLLIKMKVLNAYEASPTGRKWGKMGEGVGRGLK